jgi:hypothetical protein
MEQWQRELITALDKPMKEADDEDSGDDVISQNERMSDKLAIVADALADAGIIHNAPHAKRLWVDSSLVD